MISRYFIIISVLFSICFSESRIFKYYADTSIVIVDDITFDLKKVLKNKPKEPIENIFLKIEPVKGFEKSISWYQNKKDNRGILNRFKKIVSKLLF